MSRVDIGSVSCDVSVESSYEDSKSSSTSCDDTMRLCQDLTNLFMSRNYYEILTMIPSLGRVDAALRELAITIEVTSVSTERVKLIKYLIFILKPLGMFSRVISCYNELIYFAKLELLSNRNPELDAAIQCQISEYENNIQSLMNMDDNYIHKHRIHLPLHEQAEAYMECDGRLNEYSLGRSSIISKRLVDEALALFQSRNRPESLSSKSDPLHKLFSALKFFGPMYVFKNIQENQSLIKDYIDSEISSYLEVDYSADPKQVVKSLYEQINKTSSRTLMSLCGIIVKHQIILGFLAFLNEDYVSSVTKFNWVLSFFSQLDKKFKFFTNKNEYLSAVTRRIVYLLLVQSYMLGGIDISDDELAKVLTISVSVDEINLNFEYLSGRLSTYFLCCGYIYECLAISNKTKIIVENETSTPVDTCTRYNKEYLGEMLRKYIIASTLKATDDSSTLVIYDKIIWGLLLYGGIHLKTFWFFAYLRYAFTIEFDYGPISLNESDRYVIFKNNEILDQYENGWEVVSRIFDLWEGLKEHEKENVWDDTNGGCLLIPQVFDRQNKLTLVDIFYDESSSYNAKSFLYLSDYQIRHKLKGHIKLSNKVVREHILFSRELANLWIESFTTYQGRLPDFAKDFKDDLCE